MLLLDLPKTTNVGAAYVFERTSGGWKQQAILTAGDGVVGDRFGESVAIAGNTVIVGAPSDNVGTNIYQGSAYVFTRNGNIWTQAAHLTASDGAAGDGFGKSVAISGGIGTSRYFIGAFNDDIGTNTSQGSVYVYESGGGFYIFKTKLTASNGQANQEFGAKISISGEVVAISAGIYGTKIYFYERSALNVWSEISQLTLISNQIFSISGNYLLVGFPSANGISKIGTGVVDVYIRNGNQWIYETGISLLGAEDYDNFGSSVSLSGDYAAIGAGGVGLKGACYIYKRVGNKWNFLSKSVENTPTNGRFHGERISISDTGFFISSGYSDLGFQGTVSFGRVPID
jgi:hypothetical protein